MLDGGEGTTDGYVLINANTATTEGYVGIGKMIPNTKLHVKGDTTFEDPASTDEIAKIYASGDDGIIDVKMNGVTTIRLHGNGDSYFNTGNGLGIGTASPSEMLGVSPGSDASAEIGRAHVGYIGHSGYAGFSHYSRNSTSGYALKASSTGNTYLNAETAKHIYFSVANSTKMQLNDQGGFAVGATPASTAGHIRASNDIVAFYSDERLKEKITIGIENPIDKIKNINTFTYRHNELANTLGFVDDKIYIGVGAKSVKEGVPEAVEIAPFDADEDGISESGEDYLTVKYERLVPLLIEGIKDQQVQIDELKQEIKEIKNGTSK